MGVLDWFKRRRQRNKEEESVFQLEKPRNPAVEEPIPEPVAEKKEELDAISPTQEIEKSANSTAAKETEKTITETEKIYELSSDAVNEKKEETHEQPTTEKAATEFTTEETEKQATQKTIFKKIEKPPQSLWKLAFRGLVKRRQQKEKPEKKRKKEKKSAPEPEFLKILIFPITLASMLLGLSILPLFPQPLPVILAFLIAFLTYKKPRIGMPIGSLIIGLGLMYNLSEMNFISMLGELEIRGAFVFVSLFLLTALPIIFHSRKAVISINLGIISAISLFFSETYFLAIPLIITAIVLFKKSSFLTGVYYLLISVPLQVMQYLNLVLPIERWDWWIEPGTSPPIYVPLTEIFANVRESMLQFRLYDTSKVVYAITDQITLDPPLLPHTVQEMLSHYLDSLPGILLFLFMVAGIVSAFVFVSRIFFARSNIAHAERLLPTISATIGVALFFILAASLQNALAFRADISNAQIAVATFATMLFTSPTLFMDYTPKRTATVDMIMEKAKELKEKLKIFEDELYEVKNSLPISCGPFEVKILMVRDKLDDVLNKASMRLSEAAEIDKIFDELDNLSSEIDNLALELNTAVGEYQVFVNCEYSKWRGIFRDIGLETDVVLKTAFQKEASLKSRIEQIKEVLEVSQFFSSEVIKVAEQVYEVIRSFYDPNLPEKSQLIAFAKKKLDEKTIWIALDALFTALNNWNKQYKIQISKSVEHLQSTLTSIVNLKSKSEKMLSVLGDDFPKIMENVKAAENLKIGMERKPFNIIKILVIKDVFHSSLNVAREVCLIFYEKLKSKEEAIELIKPSDDFLWERNDALMKQMASAVEATSKLSEVKLGEVLESLPKFLANIDEWVETIALYNEIEELLLNYPIAEVAVEILFRKKKSISAEDLPFGHKYAKKYLRLVYSQKYRAFSFNEENLLLTKKT